MDEPRVSIQWKLWGLFVSRRARTRFVESKQCTHEFFSSKWECVQLLCTYYPWHILPLTLLRHYENILSHLPAVKDVIVTYPVWGVPIFIFGFALVVRFFHWTGAASFSRRDANIYVDQCVFYSSCVCLGCLNSSTS